MVASALADATRLRAADQGIAPEDAYIQYLARKFGDCPQLETETRKRATKWFSLATISRTVDEVLITRRPEYGRPVLLVTCST
jgi:hypothetical protein